MKFQEWFKKVSRVFKESFKDYLRLFQGSFQWCSRVFDGNSKEGYFKVGSRVFQEGF